MVIMVLERRADGEMKIRGRKTSKTYFEEELYYAALPELLINATHDYNFGQFI